MGGLQPRTGVLTIRNFQSTTTAAFLISGLLLACHGAPAVGQEAEEIDRWKISAELSFTDQSGNQVLRLLTGGLNVSHLQREEYRLDGSVESHYGRSDDELVALSHAASLAFDLRPESSWSPFLFVDGERNEFKRLDLRLSTGAGVKHTFLRSGFEDTSLSLAILHSYERVGQGRTEPGIARTGLVDVEHSARWSWRAKTSHELRDGLTLGHVTFYQPLWGEMANYLLRSDTELKILLTERLALSVSYQLKRDARPPEGVEPNDRLLKTGLILDF